MAVALHAAGDQEHKRFTSGNIKRDCNSAFHHETRVSLFSLSQALSHSCSLCRGAGSSHNDSSDRSNNRSIDNKVGGKLTQLLEFTAHLICEILFLSIFHLNSASSLQYLARSNYVFAFSTLRKSQSFKRITFY